MAKLLTICEDEKFIGRSSRRYYSMYLLKNLDNTENTIDLEVEKLDYKMKMVKFHDEMPKYCAVVVGYDNIYIIGGADSKCKPKTDLLILPLPLNPGDKSKKIIQKGPPLISGKFHPIAIPSKNHLYVFSKILYEFGFKSQYSFLEDLPRCEVLSWDRGSVWSALDIPSEAPRLPPPNDKETRFRYQIDAYVSGDLHSFDGVFISIKEVCSYFVSVGQGWTFSPKELPFMFEAKQICSAVYAATSRNSLYAGFICLYRFIPDEVNFHFDQLTMFPLFSNSIVGQSFPDHSFDNWMFQPLSPNKLCVIHSCVPSHMGFDSFSKTTGEPPFIIAKVLKLNWDGESGGGDDGTTTSAKKRKRERKTDKPQFELLGFTKYLDMPPLQNWCFVPAFN